MILKVIFDAPCAIQKMQVHAGYILKKKKKTQTLNNHSVPKDCFVPLIFKIVFTSAQINKSMIYPSPTLYIYIIELKPAIFAPRFTRYISTICLRKKSEKNWIKRL